MLTNELKNELLSNSFNKRHLTTMFDAVQTHVLYSVLLDELDDVKSILKKHKATKLKLIESGIKGIRIVCFKEPK